MIRSNDLNRLHPEFLGTAISLHQRLIRLHQAGTLQLRLEVFETFRSFERQDDLFSKGTTKARGGQSPHNFGLAVDFVPFLSQCEARALGVSPGWYWPEVSNPCWKILEQSAASFGLKTISWDKPHVEHPDWKKLKEK